MIRGAAALAGLLLLAACRLADAPAAEPEPPVSVRVAPVRRGDIAETLTVSGVTDALRSLRLASPVTGRVTMLSVRPGDRVRQGEVVARVMPAEHDAALNGFDLLRPYADPAERAAHERLAAGLRRRDIALRAPFPVVVAERWRNPEEQVAANDVLLEMFDPASLYVVAQAGVADAGRLRAGLPVQIEAGALWVPGEITALGSAVAVQGLTLPVRIRPTAPVQLPLRAAVRCRITLVERHDVVVLPIAALVAQSDDGRAAVMVADGGVARRRAVTVGLRGADLVEITAGLDVGTPVIVEGQYALPDDARIAPTPAHCEAGVACP